MSGDRHFLVLDELELEDHRWASIAPRYGVTNPDPPWKVSLYATLECLSVGQVVDPLERRHEEDRLGPAVFPATAGPEQQLLCLAHIMMSRGLLDEATLAERIRLVRARLEAGYTAAGSPAAQ